jgi:hypothetical protein
MRDGLANHGQLLNRRLAGRASQCAVRADFAPCELPLEMIPARCFGRSKSRVVGNPEVTILLALSSELPVIRPRSTVGCKQRVWSNLTTDHPDDWDEAMGILFPNYAPLHSGSRDAISMRGKSVMTYTPLLDTQLISVSNHPHSSSPGCAIQSG